MKESTHLFVIEDHSIVREGLRFLLAPFPQWKIVGEIADGEQALAEIERLQPDIVILDLKLPNMSGEKVLGDIRKERPGQKVIVLSQILQAAVYRRVLKLAPNAVILKTGDAGQIIAALESVKRGENWYGPELDALLREDQDDPCSAELLTERERQIAKLIARGLSNKEIAQDLDCSVETIKSHKSNLMRKLGFSNSAEISAWVIKAGLE